MQFPETGMPILLKNSPQVICDQVLWLIKNSSLDFQVKETPFSLSLSVKKRFAQHWNQSQQHQKFPTPVSSQKYGNPAQNASPSNLQTFEQNQPQHNEFHEEIESLKAINKRLNVERDNLEKELFQSEQSNKKLIKEQRNLQSKHENICLELKNCKNEKVELSKEFNKMSVAHASSKKALTDSHKAFDEKLFNLTTELTKLRLFKSDKVAEEKKIQKAAKKARQKQQKEEIVKESLEDSVVNDSTEDTSYSLPVRNAFEVLQKEDTENKIYEETSIGFKVEASKQNVDQNCNIPNLNSNSQDTPLNSNCDREPPENVNDMTKEEFEQLLNQVISNFNQKANSKPL